jgi:enoyl-CoA hydratase/carnithine racemase
MPLPRRSLGVTGRPDQQLTYDPQGSTVVLTMNRPKRMNALSLDMMARFADAWDASKPIRRCALRS